MSSSERSLSELSAVVNALIEIGRKLCPEKLPAGDGTLTDRLIVKLLQDVALAGGLREAVALCDENLDYDQAWLHSLADTPLDKLDIDEAVSEITQLWAYGDLEGILGLRFLDYVFYFDQFMADLPETPVPLPLCPHLPGIFQDVRPNVSCECQYGLPGSGSGMLLGAIAPFLNGYREEIQAWDSEEAVLREIGKYPLLAVDAWYFLPPGLAYNHFLGAVDKEHDLESVAFFNWDELHILLGQEALARQILSHHPDLSTISPRWIAGQCLNTYAGGAYDR